MSGREIWPVLIAGGRGTRFWPLSRRNQPKPLLSLCSDRPMICRACEILKPVSGDKKIFVATSEKLGPAIQKILPRIPKENFLLEPEPRDTGPALGLSLALISRKIDPEQPEPVLAFIPSDQHLKKPARFRQVLKAGAGVAAKNDLIVTIGIQPDSPGTEYGYIQPGEKIPDTGAAFRVRQFKEKPTLAKARRYLKQGFVWNAGIFLARPAVFWSAFEKHQPEFYRRLQKIARAKSARLKSTLRREFSRLKKISFDYAIMEKAKNLAVVSGDLGWSDLGSFQALDRILGKARIKNLGPGRLVSAKADRLLVRTEKLTAVLGAKNLVIIETEDVILIMDRSCEKDLKQLVRELERLGLEQYL